MSSNESSELNSSADETESTSSATLSQLIDKSLKELEDDYKNLSGKEEVGDSESNEDFGDLNNFAGKLTKKAVKEGVKEALKELAISSTPKPNWIKSKALRALEILNMPCVFWSVLASYLILALLFHGISSEEKLLIRQPNPPKPFFPQDSNIFDYYQGDFGSSFQLYNKADLTVTFFYSHWSLHAKEARNEMIRLAKVFQGSNILIRFNAVNCDAGFCKRTYKIYTYPVIMASTASNIPVFYDDVPTADRLFSWITRILKPMHRVNNNHDPIFTKNEFDLFALAYLPVEFLAPPTREYLVYYAAALKSRNPRIAFTFTTNSSVAEHFGLQGAGWFKVVNKLYKISNNTNSQAVLDTIQRYHDENLNNTVSFLRTELDERDGLKSTQLYTLVNKTKNAVILFTSMLGTYRTSENYEAFRQIVSEYSSCSEPTTRESVDTNFIFNPISADKSCKFEKQSLNKCCDTMKNNDYCTTTKNEENEQSDVNEINTKRDDEIVNLENCQNLSIFNQAKLRRYCCKKGTEQPKLSFEQTSQCNLLKLIKQTRPYGTFPFKSTSLNTDNLSLSTEGTISLSKGKLEILKKFSCQANRTLNFIVADKKYSSHFYRKWNLKAEKYNTHLHQDHLALISLEKEKIYSNPLNSWNEALDFLINHHEEKLEPTIFDESNQESMFSTEPQHYDEENFHSIPTKLTRLTLISFKTEILNNPNRSYSALVFFSAGAHNGHSVAVTHILHTVKQEFQQYESLLQFYIIDTSRNTLPASFDFDTLPAFVFFPPKQNPSVQIARYPTGLPFSVPNLLAFIISRAQPELKWRLALRSCSAKCLQQNRRKLINFDRFIRDDIRTVRLTKKWMAHNRVANKHFAMTLKRRKLQQASAHSLLNILRLIEDNLQRTESTVPAFKDLSNLDPNHILVQESLLIRYLTTQNFGNY